VRKKPRGRRTCQASPANVPPTTMACWLLTISAALGAYDIRKLTAMRAASLVSDGHVANFQRETAVVLRGVSSLDAPPLRRLGAPSQQELGSVADELALAAALVSRLLGAEALRDPFGTWMHGWDNAYDHYVYWRSADLQPRRVAMVVLPREPHCLTLCGYPESVVSRTAYSSTSYPSAWCGHELPTNLAEPEIELDAGDALILDGTNTEGLGGLGGGHLIYRFEMCDASSEGVLWVTPSAEEGGRESSANAMLQQFAVAAKSAGLARVRHEREGVSI